MKWYTIRRFKTVCGLLPSLLVILSASSVFSSGIQVISMADGARSRPGPDEDAASALPDPISESTQSGGGGSTGTGSPALTTKEREEAPPVLFGVSGTVTYAELFGTPPANPTLMDLEELSAEDSDYRRESHAISEFGPSVSWSEQISNDVGLITCSGSGSNGTLTLTVEADIDFTPPLCMICSSWFEFTGTVTAWVRDCNTPMSAEYGAGGSVHVDHPEGCGSVGPHGLAIWGSTSVGSGSDCSEGTLPIDESAQVGGTCLNAQYFAEYGAYYCPADVRSFHVEAFYSDGLHLFGGPKRIVAQVNGTATYTVTPELGQPPTAGMDVQTDCPLCSRPILLASTAEDPDGGDVSVTWTFPGGQPPTATGPEAVVIWSDPGSHTVVMEVTDDECQTETTSRSIEVGRPKACVFDLVQEWCGWDPRDYIVADLLVGDIKDDLDDAGWDPVEVDVESLNDICGCLADPCVRGASFVGHAVDGLNADCNTMVIKTECPPGSNAAVTPSDLVNCAGSSPLEYVESINCNVDPEVLGDALGVPPGKRFGPETKRHRGANGNCIGLVNAGAELDRRWSHDYPYPPGCPGEIALANDRPAGGVAGRSRPQTDYVGYWVCNGDLTRCSRDYMPVLGGLAGSFELEGEGFEAAVDSAMFAVGIYADGAEGDSVLVSIGMVGDPVPVSGGMLPRRLHLDWEMPSGIEADSVVVILTYTEAELAENAISEEDLEVFFIPGDSINVLRSVPGRFDLMENRVVCLVKGPGSLGLGQSGLFFVRGDTDASGEINIADPIYNLTYQFAGGDSPPCLDAADVDDSGEINIADPIYNLTYQFAGGAPPPAPGAGCGTDGTAEDGLGCLSFPPCGRGTDQGGLHADEVEVREYPAMGTEGGSSPASEFFRIGPWMILEEGVAACPVTLRAEIPIRGLEATFSTSSGQFQFEGFVSEGGGLGFDFLSAMDTPGADAVRLGAIPDLSLEDALAPGSYLLGRMVFRYHGAVPMSADLPLAIHGLLVSSSGAVLSLGGDDETPTSTDGPSAPIRDGSLRGTEARVDLRAPAPNPAGNAVSVAFGLPLESEILLAVLDVAGRRVAILREGLQSAGWHIVEWDGRDANGRRVSPGVYFLRLSGAGPERVQRLIMIR